MLMDEPSSHLDLGQQIAALDALSALARERGTALVMVLHDLHLALRYADMRSLLATATPSPGRATTCSPRMRCRELFGHRLAAVGEGSTRTLLPG